MELCSLPVIYLGPNYGGGNEDNGNLLHALIFITSMYGASLVAQRLKRPPPMRETRVRSLGREDPLEKEMATHSSTLAWRIPWMEEPGGLKSIGSQRVGYDFTFFSFQAFVNVLCFKLL